ncbi:hypothetical protein [Sphingobacterium sp. T2]|uniref:hypothetical protein n=1 Tax=Sphingobacterium sp. T2 TaxID=1590596 RepID=UPI00057B91A3|nr:hypothetical protein [Sphingobacterium sp. T2]
MKGNKSDFSMTFYDGEEKRLFLEFVHDTNKTIEWVKSKNIDGHIQWFKTEKIEQFFGLSSTSSTVIVIIHCSQDR